MIEVIGHRGAPTKAPENTAASFTAALDAGADILETDARLTADGHVVLSHDPDFSRLSGDARPISGLTRKEVESIDLGGGEPPCFWDDALRRFPGARFNVDLKLADRGLIDSYVAILRHAGATDRVVTASFLDRNLRAFRRACPDGKISAGRVRVLGLVVAAALGWRPGRRKGETAIQLPEVAGPVTLVTPKRLGRWHRKGWAIHVWTVDNEDDMRRLIEAGVDGIVTNEPGKLRSLLDAMAAEENS